MSMQYIRNYYGVPAKRGGRVIYSGERHARTGTIVGSRGATPHGRLNIWLRSAIELQM